MKTSDSEILKTALGLFSENGFEGTSVRDIARKLGITQSSLYKHFSSKEAILAAVFEEMKKRYDREAESMSLHIESRDGTDSAVFSEMSGELVAAKVRKLIEFSLDEPFVRDFRKLITALQFRSAEYGRIYSERYGERMTAYHESLFRALIIKGVMKECEDPHILSIEYTAPVFYLLGVIDREPERRDECLSLMEKHVISFYKAHTKREI